MSRCEHLTGSFKSIPFVPRCFLPTNFRLSGWLAIDSKQTNSICLQLRLTCLLWLEIRADWKIRKASSLEKAPSTYKTFFLLIYVTHTTFLFMMNGVFIFLITPPLGNNLC